MKQVKRKKTENWSSDKKCKINFWNKISESDIIRTWKLDVHTRYYGYLE